MNNDRFPSPLARVVRGGLVESIHRGHLVCCKPDGKITTSLGDTEFPTYLRSLAKPFQAVPVVLDGVYERYGLTPPELALMCGSVSGQDFHVAAVRSVLGKIGLDESVMSCGIHRPSHRPTAKKMQEEGLKPLPVHNNCAGKHAAMLALCTHHGWSVEGYTAVDHPVQLHVKKMVALCCGLEAGDLGVGIDGCGVPVFQAPLKAIARGYARLAAPGDDPALNAEIAKAIEITMSAATAHPEMVAGDERICTDAMRAAKCPLFAKVGTEGGYGLSFKEQGFGLALKVEDGHLRALPPIVVELLKNAGELDKEGLQSLETYHSSKLRNFRKEVIGSVEPAPELGEFRIP